MNVLVVAGLISLPFVYVLVRRPILRRLALRNAVRRPREALLVVLGSLLGAAIITGSAVVGDTMNSSIRQVARQHLGPIDELVVARNVTQWRALSSRLRSLPPAQVDGVLPLATVDAATTSRSGETLRSVPDSRLVALDFQSAVDFGRDPASTGIRGPAPEPGHAAVTTDLARGLGIVPGASLRVFAYGRPRTLIVDRILPRTGIAGFGTGNQQEARNVLVSFTTFTSLLSTGMAGGSPPTWMVAVSNRGGVESGAAASPDVKTAILDSAGGLHPQVMLIKQQVLDMADQVGNGFAQMFTAMGSFGVLAGLLLLVNLFVMLAAERKPELGMARAIGMKRSALVGAFATEGFLYALTASLLGTLAGVGLGRALVALSQRAFSSEHNQLDLYFTVKAGSLAQAFVMSFAVAVLAIVIMSVRVSRLNIIRAIRDIAEPPTRRRRRSLYVGAAAVVLGGIWTIAAAPAAEPFGLLLGPTLVLIGLAPALGRIAPSRSSNTAVAALVVGWSAVVFGVFPASAEGASIMMYVAQGIVMTAGGVALIILQQDRIGRGLRRFGGKALSLRLGLAYPLARRSRTGLTVAMYALVVFILTFITSIAYMVDREVSTASANVAGGAQVFVKSSNANPIPITDLSRVPNIEKIAPLWQVSASFALRGAAEEHVWPLTAFNERLIRLDPPKLEDRGRYVSDKVAWNAVLSDPDLIVADPSFLQGRGARPTSRFGSETASR